MRCAAKSACNFTRLRSGFIDKRKEIDMSASQNIEENAGISLKSAALIAGFGLLVMAVCAPLAYMHFMGQGVVPDDPAATVANFQANGTPYLIGVVLLFTTYVMDVIVAWALYWYLRPGQPAISQLVAWARLVYTALAFIGLWASLSAYDLAIGGGASDAALHAGVAAHLSAASTMGALALCFFVSSSFSILFSFLVSSQCSPLVLCS